LPANERIYFFISAGRHPSAARRNILEPKALTVPASESTARLRRAMATGAWHSSNRTGAPLWGKIGPL
jgi:hypothetical protein